MAQTISHGDSAIDDLASSPPMHHKKGPRRDSAIDGLSSSPPKEKGHRRQSSSVPGVWNINDLGTFLLPLSPSFSLSHDHV